MSTFGQTLRGERENRGLSIRELSEKMGVDRDRLLALERNDFEALPDDAAMVPLLHTYAASLGVEADLMIEDYRRERDRCLSQLSKEVNLATYRKTPLPPPAPRTDGHRASPFPRLSVLSAIAGTLVILATWWVFSRGPAPDPSSASADASVAAGTAAEATGPLTTDSSPAGADRSRVATATTAPVTSSPAGLTVVQQGVGTAVRNRELVGERSRFEPGAKVWYWTEIQGGKAGDRIDHVWLADGKETARIRLKLGGPRWRTYSAKTLHAGSARDWAVEVREASGRVLARREFVAVR